MVSNTVTDSGSNLWTPVPLILNAFSLILSGSSYFPSHWTAGYFGFLGALLRDEERIGRSYHILAGGAPRRYDCTCIVSFCLFLLLLILILRYQEMEFFVSYEKGLQATKALIKCFEGKEKMRTNVPVVIRNAAQDDGYAQLICIFTLLYFSSISSSLMKLDG
jgi:hypothetical protein